MSIWLLCARRVRVRVRVERVIRYKILNMASLIHLDQGDRKQITGKELLMYD